VFAIVSMNLPFPHPKLEKWEKNGSKVKISKKLGILKAAQNKKKISPSMVEVFHISTKSLFFWY
jgi:hypothetical protein